MSKDNDKLIEKLRSYFTKWEWIVVKWGWKFDVNYCDSYDDMPDETSSTEAAAIAFCNWEYLEADIYFNMKVIAELDDERIEYCVVHELTHLLLNPTKRDMEEMSATTIARIILMAQRVEEVSEIPCAECGGECVEFEIPTDIWNYVIRIKGVEHDKEYLCKECWFKSLRVKLGIDKELN